MYIWPIGKIWSKVEEKRKKKKEEEDRKVLTRAKNLLLIYQLISGITKLTKSAKSKWMSLLCAVIFYGQSVYNATRRPKRPHLRWLKQKTKQLVFITLKVNESVTMISISSQNHTQKSTWHLHLHKKHHIRICWNLVGLIKSSSQ